MTNYQRNEAARIGNQRELDVAADAERAARLRAIRAENIKRTEAAA